MIPAVRHCYFFLFIYFCLCWVFIAAHSFIAANGGHSPVSCVISRCSGFSCCGARAPAHVGSVVAGPEPQGAGSEVAGPEPQGAGSEVAGPEPQGTGSVVAVRSPRAQAQKLQAAAWHAGPSRTRGQTRVSCTGGGFLTTEPPGKPRHHYFLNTTLLFLPSL